MQESISLKLSNIKLYVQNNLFVQAIELRKSLYIKDNMLVHTTLILTGIV